MDEYILYATCYTCIRGSSLSRKKSPRMLKLITVMLMARPGKITIQGAELIYARFRLIIEPQVGVGGCTPRPRNDSAASSRMNPPTRRLPATRISGSAFGSICLYKILDDEAPRARDAST